MKAVMRAKVFAAETRELVRDARRLVAQPLEELTRLQTLEDATRFGDRHELVCFNGQILRTLWVFSMIQELAVTHFLETGTFRALTSLTVCRHFRVETFSVDVDPAFVRRARLLSVAVLGTGAVRYHLEGTDSRAALRKWLHALPPGAIPFIYLDAHSNTRKTQPLRDELAMCLERGRCLVVIDDFRIPDDPEFGYDSANDFEIGMDSLREFVSDERVSLRLPAYLASLESGYRRGAAAMLIDLASDDRAFPANLFAGPRAGLLRDVE